MLRIARDPAKVEDQVRLLARTLIDVALEPDGKAAACKAVTKWVRLPSASLIRPGQRRSRPAGADQGPGFQPGRIFFRYFLATPTCLWGSTVAYGRAVPGCATRPNLHRCPTAAGKREVPISVSAPPTVLAARCGTRAVTVICGLSLGTTYLEFPIRSSPAKTCLAA